MRPEDLTPAIGVGAERIGLSLTTMQTGKLAAFAQLLLKWNATHNLTAIDTPQAVLTHHLLDCLAIVPALRRLRPAGATRVLDVGSGGGLPGIVLAVAQPDWSFTLIDAVGKKTAFLTHAKLELGLTNIDVVHARVEKLKSAAFDLIVSRAFASLPEFVRLSRAALAPGGIWVAMRGAAAVDAADNLPADVHIDEVVKLRVPHLGADRHLVVLRATSGPPAPSP